MAWALLCHSQRDPTLNPFHRPLTTTFALFAALAACNGGSDSQVDCQATTVPKYAEMTAWTKCTNCHSTTLSGPTRAGAPATINFDKYDEAVMDADRAKSEVETGSMPPGGGLSAEEKAQIVEWASCDTPQ